MKSQRCVICCIFTPSLYNSCTSSCLTDLEEEAAEPHGSFGSIQNLRTGDTGLIPRLGKYSFREAQV